MKTSESIKAVYPALLEVQKEIKNVEKTGKNEFFKGAKYVTLPDVLDTVRPLLNKSGLVLVQGAESRDGGPLVTTRIVHSGSGEWVETETQVTVEAGPQKYGSAITYLRRYSLMALLGICGEADDDGNAGQAPSTNGKSKGTAEVSVQERIAKLPVDVKDLMARAGCNTFAQRYQLLQAKAWNLDAVKKACMDEIKKKSSE